MDALKQNTGRKKKKKASGLMEELHCLLLPECLIQDQGQLRKLEEDEVAAGGWCALKERVAAY